MVLIFISLENLLHCDTRVLRLYTQDWITRNSLVGTQRAHSVRKIIFEVNLPKTETTKLYTAIERCLQIIHVNTSCAKAPRAPRSSRYATWCCPYGQIQISCGANKQTMNRAATLLICDARLIPLQFIESYTNFVFKTSITQCPTYGVVHLNLVKMRKISKCRNTAKTSTHRTKIRVDIKSDQMWCFRRSLPLCYQSSSRLAIHAMI